MDIKNFIDIQAIKSHVIENNLLENDEYFNKVTSKVSTLTCKRYLSNGLLNTDEHIELLNATAIVIACAELETKDN